MREHLTLSLANLRLGRRPRPARALEAADSRTPFAHRVNCALRCSRSSLLLGLTAARGLTLLFSTASVCMSSPSLPFRPLLLPTRSCAFCAPHFITRKSGDVAACIDIFIVRTLLVRFVVSQFPLMPQSVGSSYDPVMRLVA